MRQTGVDNGSASREHMLMLPTRKLRLYLETTIWNVYFADETPDRQKATQDFCQQVRRGAFDVFASNLVLEELDAAPEPRRAQLLDLLSELNPVVLPVSVEARRLAKHFVDNDVIPAKYSDDAIHIAVALTHGLDVMLSWNFKHIVKLKTRRFVSATCRLGGYNELEICTPQEVLFDA